MKDKIKRCPHCGASMKSFHHSLSSGLVSALTKAIRFVHLQNKNEFHLQKDLENLTKNEYNNFQKLRFHALVAKIDKKPGYWLITKRGGQFLRGNISVPVRVETFRNKVIRHSSELVHLNQLRNKIPEFEKDFLFEYQQVKEEFFSGNTLFNFDLSTG